MATQDTSSEATSTASTPSPLLKVFAPDPVNLHGNAPLRNIRDKIYAYAWSRDRRDDQKLDWVVTQWGFNRNVPERYIPNTPYGTAAFQRLDELPCNLHLVNKQISEDFTRFIYTVNELEIDVDLKAVCTEQGKAGLQNVVTLLQNPNFQKFTRTARVRIHFPAQYPFNSLPAFNHRALHDIAGSLDKFKQLVHLVVRVVPMQGQLSDYELRAAAFPFYPMHMTNWSIQILNDKTSPCKWETLDGQQARILDKAWGLHHEHESLTASVKPAITFQQLASTESAARNVAANKSGSQKRKYRKMKAAACAPSVDAIGTVENSTTSSGTIHAHHSTTLDTHSWGAEVAAFESTEDEVVDDVTTVEVGVDIDAPVMGPNIDVVQASGTRQAPLTLVVSSSTLHTPAQSHIARSTTTYRSSSSAQITCMLSPASSSDGAETSTNTAYNVNTNGHEIQEPRDFCPPSPALSSVTLDAASDDRDTPDCSKNTKQDSLATKPSGNNAETKQAKRKRKHGKKAKRTNITESAEAQSATDSIDRIDTQDQLIVDSSCNEINVNSSDHGDRVNSKPANLGNYELQVSSADPRYIYYHDPETGNTHIIQRGARVDRYLRQQMRRRDDASKREAEKKHARDKRNSRKAKQLLLRRASIAVNSPLSRVMEPRRESSKKKVPLQDRNSDTGADVSSTDQFSELGPMVSPALKARNSNLDSLVSGPDHLVQNLAPSNTAPQNNGVFPDGHDQAPEFDVFGWNNDNEDGQEINTTVQEYIEDWGRTCPSDEDSSRTSEKQHCVHEDDTHQPAQELSPQSLACLHGEIGNAPLHEAEYVVSQLQDKLCPRGFRSTDAEALDLSDQGSFASGKMVEDSIHGKRNAESMTSEHGNAGRTVYPELGAGRAAAPATAIADHNSGKHLAPRIQLLHGRKHNAGTSAKGPQRGHNSRRGWGQQHLLAQDARRSHRGTGAQFPSALVQDANINKTRNNWAAKVQAGDETLQHKRREQLAELEREMKANGTNYSHHESRIKDHWMKTDDNGICIGEGTEQVVYGTQSQGSGAPSLSGLGAIQGSQRPQELD